MPEIMEQIKTLSRRQQLALLREIALLLEEEEPDSLSSPNERELPPVTENERQMLTPRVEEALQNPLGRRSWSQVKTSLLEQIGDAN